MRIKRILCDKAGKQTRILTVRRKKLYISLIGRRKMVNFVEILENILKLNSSVTKKYPFIVWGKHEYRESSTKKYQILSIRDEKILNFFVKALKNREFSDNSRKNWNDLWSAAKWSWYLPVYDDKKLRVSFCCVKKCRFRR